MSSDQIIFAGVDISSGRRPVTFAALDGDLKILTLEKWNIAESLAYLEQYESALLAITSSSQKRENQAEFKNKITLAGFKPSRGESATRQWVETDAQDCFHALSGQEILPRRTLEGRIQRALILYEEGLRIPDPMDFFEEITRHKLMQGILPLENVYLFRQLDALAAAYIAWMTLNRSGQMEIQGGNTVRPREQTSD